MITSLASRVVLLSLLGFTVACGPDSGGTGTDTDGSGGAATEPGPSTGDDLPTTGATTGDEPPTTGDDSPSTGDTGATDTGETGTPLFPMCEEPASQDDVGFQVTGTDLPLDVPLDVVCTVMSSETAQDFTAKIGLTCVDTMSAEFGVTIELQLFYEADLVAFDGAPQVRLQYDDVDSEQRELLALRRVGDDALLLFGARGFNIFKTETDALWAPLAIGGVAETLCPTDGSCEAITRAALDITLGEVTERVFDRDFVKFTAPDLSVHVGSAMFVDLQAGEQCPPGDGPEGFETTLVVIAEK